MFLVVHKKLLFLFTCLCFFLALFSGCKKDDTSVDFHEDYFGMGDRRYVEYDVLEIYHDHIAGIHDTDSYRMKVVFGTASDTVMDNEGRACRRVYRSVFNTATGLYEMKDLWTAIIVDKRAEMVEENQRKIKLVFAPSLNKDWNVNAFNNEEVLNAYYKSIHKEMQVGSLNFDSTLIVEQDSVLNLIQYKRKYEIYANDVGMVKKHYQDYQINNFNYLFPLKGDELFMTVVAYGVE